jgi:hypothetical protein
MHAQVKRFERAFGYDATYMHEVIDASLPAAWKFVAVQMMSNHCEDVSKDAWHAAHLAGALSEDCGPCAQLCIDMARKDGMEAEKLAALVRGDIEAAGPDAALGYRYGMAVATNSDQVLALVEQARERYGESGLVSLAYSVTTARMYPTLKRAMGHGAVCAKLVVSNETIAVRHAA